MQLNLTAIKNLNTPEEKTSLVGVLEKTRLFNDVHPTVIHSLVSQCDRKLYDSGVTILVEGEASDGQAYIILSGEAHVYRGGNKVGVLTTGAIFGEYALICEEPRSATVQSASPLECLILDEAKVLQITNETNKLNDILTERIMGNSGE